MGSGRGGARRPRSSVAKSSLWMVDFPPSVNRLIGLWWLAKIFYPEHFDEDIRALTRDFYSQFYHVAPSDLDIDRVLEGSG